MRIYSDKSTAAWMESATNWHNMISLQFWPGLHYSVDLRIQTYTETGSVKIWKTRHKPVDIRIFLQYTEQSSMHVTISSHLNQNWTGSVNCWRFSVSRSGLCSVRFRWGRRTLLNTKYEVLTRTYCRSVSSSSRMIFLMRGEFGRGRSVA